MKLSKHILLFLIPLFVISCGQTKDSSGENNEAVLAQDSSLNELLEGSIIPPTKNRKDTLSFENTPCGWDTSLCSLPKDHEAHLDPYYNGHLCENFDPEQIDFSKEYLQLQETSTKKYGVDVTNSIKNYKYVLDSLFNYGDFQNDGVIGANYSRIRVHIDKTNKNKYNQFTILGQTNVNGNVCDFQGNMDIYRIYEYKENFDYPGQATLFATYKFYEDSTQKHVGVFEGTFECSVLINHEQQTIKLDEGMAIADGYYNRTFVGTWTPYKSSLPKKCIWGDNRLPFTFDFDQGDGEMMINEKYANNGWQPYIDRTEYEYSNGKSQLKNIWWK